MEKSIGDLKKYSKRAVAAVWINYIVWTVIAIVLISSIYTKSVRDRATMAKENFESILQMISVNPELPGVFIEQVEDGTVMGIELERLIGDQNFSIGEGILCEEASFKFLKKENDKGYLVEVPIKFIEKFFNVPKIIWYIADENGKILYSSTPLVLSESSKDVLKGSDHFYQFTTFNILGSDYVLGIGEQWINSLMFLLVSLGIIIFISYLPLALTISKIAAETNEIQNDQKELSKVLENRDIKVIVHYKEHIKLLTAIKSCSSERKKLLNELGKLREELEKYKKKIELEREIARAHFKKLLTVLGQEIEERSHSVTPDIKTMVEVALLTAQELGVQDEEELEAIEFGVILHDIGMIEIPESILHKPGILTENERAIVEKHPLIGARLVSQLSLSPLLEDIIKHHHERYNGQGYPDGLSGDHISTRAKVVNLVDTYFAIISKRFHRAPYPKKEALRIIESEKGKSFDPKVVEVFKRVISKSIES